MHRTGIATKRGVWAGLRALRTRREGRARALSRGSASAIVAVVALVIALAGPAHPANATDYPTWDELQAAKANTSQAAAKVAEIKTIIAGLKDQVAATEAEAEAKGFALQKAQDDFYAASARAEDLEAQAKDSAKKADAATRQAGQLASQLYRTGGSDLSVNLLLQGEGGNGEGAEELLSKLGSMSKLVERSTEIYEGAQSAENNARSLGDQAEAAKAEREKLRKKAESAMAEAQAAADAAAAALAESKAKSIELEQQLAFLQDTEAKTATAYKAGVAERARIAAEKEAARRAAEEAAREAAAESGDSGGGLGGGYVGDEGWAVPASGRITDVFGPRATICDSSGENCSNSFHHGTDLGAGCGANIYAAHAGTVVYTGRMGTYGNFIEIDHGGGVATGYAHIVDGGIHVSNGEHVDAGEVIASVGMTGAADGCHLHFEVRIDYGYQIDPQPFMADRGVPLG
jgi:murein DD-endopeptidase MepM/ murein hydrolase activator NlpD